MTHRARILADRLVAMPVAFLFNGLARVLGVVLPARLRSDDLR